MEKKTYDLSITVLKRFNNAGILPHIILIGSWSVYFYRYYFRSKSYSAFIRTRDMDFLVPIPFKFKKNLDVFELVEDLGFLEGYRGSQGYIRLEHPELTVEFLVPEKGRGSDKPYPLPQLAINAQPLRYLNFLADNSIVIHADDLAIKVPHPAAYALHKFIIFKRREKIAKQDKDIEGAIRVFRALVDNKEDKAIKQIFAKMHNKWQKTVLKNLEAIDEWEIIDILKSA